MHGHPEGLVSDLDFPEHTHNLDAVMCASSRLACLTLTNLSIDFSGTVDYLLVLRKGSPTKGCLSVNREELEGSKLGTSSRSGAKPSWYMHLRYYGGYYLKTSSDVFGTGFDVLFYISVQS